MALLSYLIYLSLNRKWNAMKINEHTLEEWLDAIYPLCMNAKASYFYCEYLYNPHTKEEAEFINDSRHFRHISHSLFRILIIDLAKLVNHENSNDMFSFPKLFKFLKTLDMVGEKAERIKALEVDFYQYDVLIKSILTLRNKLYAHSDQAKMNFEAMNVTFPNLLSLIDCLCKTLQEIAYITMDWELVFHAYFNQQERLLWDDFRTLVYARKLRRRGRLKRH